MPKATVLVVDDERELMKVLKGGLAGWAWASPDRGSGRHRIGSHVIVFTAKTRDADERLAKHIQELLPSST